MDRFVVDAGPFIHLDQIVQIRLLKNLPLLFVPSSVILEIKHGYSSSELKAIEQWPNVKVITFTREMTHWIKTVLRKASLHQGESDCLRFALENHPCILLTDDLAARSTAEKLSIEVHGTVGVIALAVKRKWLSFHRAEEALHLLYYRSSLFVAEAIIESAIRTLRQAQNRG